MPGIAWKRWNWLRNGLIPLLSAAMRAAWLAPLLQLLLRSRYVHPAGASFPAWLILALLLGGSAWERLWRDRPRATLAIILGGFAVVIGVTSVSLGIDWRHPFRWWWEFVWTLSDILSGLPAGLVVIAATTALWRRGLLMRWSSYAELQQSFFIGTAMLALLLLFREGVAGVPRVSLLVPLATFISCSLLALALVSFSHAIALEQTTDSGTPTPPRQWLLVLGGLVAGILALGWLLALIVSPNLLARVFGVFRPIWLFIGRALLMVVAGIGYLFFLLISPIVNAIRDLVQQVVPVDNLAEGGELPDLFDPEMLANLDVPPGAQTGIQIIVIALLIVGITIALLRLRQRLYGRDSVNVPERRESIWEPGLLGQQLRAALLGRRRGGTRYLALNDEPARESIRLLYRRLLRLAAREGLPRPPAITPLAFAEQLAARLPSAASDTRRLTDAYLWARYTAEPLPADMAPAAHGAWERIEAAWRHPPEPRGG